MHHYEFFHLHQLDWKICMHKPRKGTITINHIHLQFEKLYSCQPIEWPPPTPFLVNLMVPLKLHRVVNYHTSLMMCFMICCGLLIGVIFFCNEYPLQYFVDGFFFLSLWRCIHDWGTKKEWTFLQDCKRQLWIVFKLHYYRCSRLLYGNR